MDQIKHAPLRINEIRSKYKVIDKVGKGTYGTVFKVLNLQDNKYYAIKKFQNTEAKLQVEGFPITALRQISLLKQLNHANIVNLKQIICSRPNKRNLYRGSTFMVFQYMHHDFAGLFRSKVKFTVPQIKSIMKQLIEGCGFLHQNKVMHRDIKSANILMNDQGTVQLADFGLGRRTRFDSIYTYKVVTLWYRAPELLLGCKSYNHKVDVWSIGCVFAELLTGDVLFKKDSEYAIIEKIYEVCGDLDINEYTQEYLRACVYYNDMKPKKQYKNTLASFIRKICPDIDSITIEFLQGLLELNPYKRLSCEQALLHEYFKRQPRACEPQQIQKLDVEYHQMFRDRSLKIQRKQRKASLNWSEEQEKKKPKQEPKQQKPYRHQERYPKPHFKNDRDRNPDKNYQRSRNPIRQKNYEQRKPDYPKREYPVSEKKYQEPKLRKKYSKSPSRSRKSSSSSSRSKRSRTRDNKKNRYENREEKKPYIKQSDHYEKKKIQIIISKKDNGIHSYPEKDRERYRESDKDRQYEYDTKWSSKQRRNQSYKKEYVSHKEERYYKEKPHDYKERDMKSPNRRSSEYDDRKHEKLRGNSRYPKENYEKSSSRYSPAKDKYKEQSKSKSYTKQKHQSSQYRSKDEYRNYDKDQTDHYPKTYTSRDSKQYSRNQHTPSQKYHQDRKRHHSPPKQRQYRNDRDREYRNDREYREYEKSSYDYHKKQSRIRDDSRSYKKISIQRQRSADRKKYSPRKNMDIENYYRS